MQELTAVTFNYIVLSQFMLEKNKFKPHLIALLWHGNPHEVRLNENNVVKCFLRVQISRLSNCAFEKKKENTIKKK